MSAVIASIVTQLNDALPSLTRSMKVRVAGGHRGNTVVAA